MRNLTIEAAAVVLSVFMASCASPTTDQPAPESETIAVFTKNQVNPFFQAIRLGADDAAKQMGAKVVHYVPTKPDSIPEQMSQIEDAIIHRPDAIVFIPVDYKAMVPGVEKFGAAGIPVVNISDHLDSGEVVGFYGYDEEELALHTGRYLLQRLGGKGNVVIIEGVGGSANNQFRLAGYRRALGEFPSVKVLASQPANFQRLQALQVMENLLQTHPKIDGVMSANESMALGAIEALEGANREALVVGFGGTTDAIDAIKQGRLLATGDNDGFLQGCLGMMAAIRHVRKIRVPADFRFQLRVIDSSNYAGADTPYAERRCPAWETVIPG
jgi:ribose transport system substrate-binding protein